MKNRISPFLFSVFLCFYLNSSAAAQLSAELDSITVTATRISTDISESGKSVSVLTRRDIEQMPVTSVDELLRSLPGININARQGFGVQADVGIRGSTYSQVLFMIDNVPLNDPLTAHFNTNIPVSLSEIGRIELIRGPAGTSFGADAVGGVVHIKTNLYLEREAELPDERGLNRVHVDLSAGEHNLQVADAAAGIQSGKWRFSASARTARSDGETYPNAGFAEGVSEEETYNTYFDLANISAALSHRFNNYWSWYLRAGTDKRDFNARYFYTRSPWDESVEEITSQWALSSLTRNRGQHRSELNTSVRSVNDIFNFNAAISPVNEHTTRQIFFNASHQYEMSGDSGRFDHIRLMGGAQYLRKGIESTDRGDHRDGSGGLYAIASIKWLNGLSINSSLRFQADTHGNTDLLPQLSAAMNLGSVTLRSSVGRAIRVGDFTERYISTEIPDLLPERNIGNPGLEPERSTTVDFGLDWSPVGMLRISPTLFYRTSTNLIDYVLTSSSQIPDAPNLRPDAEYFYAMNIAESTTQGLELLAGIQTQPARGKTLSFQGSYTYIRTSGDGDGVSRYIANHPSHQIHAGIRYSGSWLTLDSRSSYYVRSSEADELVRGEVPSSYFLTHLRITVSPFESQIRFYTRILNLTDTDYQEILGAPMPGRWVAGGIQIGL